MDLNFQTCLVYHGFGTKSPNPWNLIAVPKTLVDICFSPISFFLAFVSGDYFFSKSGWIWHLGPFQFVQLGSVEPYLKSSYFYFKGSKIQIFPDFWQLFLFLLSKVIQSGFFCLQVIFQSSCNQGKSFWMTFENKNRKSCQKSWKIWIFEPLE